MMTYQNVTQALQRAGVPLEAAEAHAIVCGFVCGSQGAKADQLWLDQMFEEIDMSNVLARECENLLLQLKNQAMQSINSPEFEFAPLLPDDDESIEIRAGAMKQWCDGFLFGLGLSGYSRRVSPEAREFLQDLTAISRLQTDASPSEEQETAYAEVLEYIRVGVLLINESQFRADSGGRKDKH
jgi:yecA family protein